MAKSSSPPRRRKPEGDLAALGKRFGLPGKPASRASPILEPMLVQIVYSCASQRHLRRRWFSPHAPSDRAAFLSRANRIV